jgi:hypothetical protein
MKKTILSFLVAAALICSAFGNVTIHGTTLEKFRDSFVEMINAAEASGDYKAQDIALLKRGLAKITLEITAYATQHGGPNATPNRIKVYEAEYLQKYQGADAKMFIEILKEKPQHNTSKKVLAEVSKLDNKNLPSEQGLVKNLITKFYIEKKINFCF